MKLLLDDFQSISFHDSTLSKVEEQPGYIRMEIDSAYIRLPIKDAGGKEWTLFECSLECHGVNLSEKQEWDDTRTAKPSSNPNLPIDEILENDVKEDFLELAGLTHDKSWGVWRIKAQYFELHWKTQEEFKKD